MVFQGGVGGVWEALMASQQNLDTVGNSNGVEVPVQHEVAPDPELDFSTSVEGSRNEIDLLELQEKMDTLGLNNNVGAPNDEGKLVAVEDPTNNTAYRVYCSELVDELLDDEELDDDGYLRIFPSNSALRRNPKSRLRWGPDLHEWFVTVVQQLGGSIKATPKCIQYKMGIRGINLYHVKSHLQKYRSRLAQEQTGIAKKGKSTKIAGVPVGSRKPLSLRPRNGNCSKPKKSKGKAKAGPKKQGSRQKKMPNASEKLGNQSSGDTNIPSGSLSGSLTVQNPNTAGTSATISSGSYFRPNATVSGTSAAISNGSYLGQNSTGAALSSGSYFGSNPTGFGTSSTVPSGSYLGQNPTNVGNNASIASQSYFHQNQNSIGPNATFVSGSYFVPNSSSVGTNTTAVSASYFVQNPSSIGIMAPGQNFSHDQVNANNSVPAARPQSQFPSVMRLPGLSQQGFNATPARARNALQISGSDIVHPSLNVDDIVPTNQNNNYGASNYGRGAGREL